MAALKGHGDVVKDLLGAGADVNKADTYGQTPLIKAAKGGHGDVVEHLLGAGAV
jgi:ankyrin repeat protein